MVGVRRRRGARSRPWVAFNLARFDKPVFLSTGIGNTLAARQLRPDLLRQATSATTRSASPGPYPPRSTSRCSDTAPRKYAIDYIEDHKSRLPLVVAARVGRLWGVFKPGQTTALDWWIEGRGRVPSWIALFFYYAMIPFAVLGLVRMWRRKITILPDHRRRW